MTLHTLKMLAAVGFFLVAATGTSKAQVSGSTEIVGKVTGLAGNAVAMQDAVPRPLSIGGDIRIGDVLSTGRDSRLAIRMVDEAEFSLGERSVFVVQEYFLSSDRKDGNAVLRLMNGAVRAVSGQIAQLDGQPFQLRTEVATIGVRGTEFWGGLLDGVHQFALLAGTAIIVENKAGRVEITRPGDGTWLENDATPPPAPTDWGTEKLTRAAAITAVR